MYEVVRYFDDHFEGVIESNLTHEQAINKRDELNNRPRAYVNYEVRELTQHETKQTK